MRRDKIGIPLLSVAFAVLVMGTYRSDCCLARTQGQAEQITDFAEIGETVRSDTWELRVHGKYVALRKDVVHRFGSGGTWAQIVGELKAIGDGYLLDVHLGLQNLRDETAQFQLADFSIGEGAFSSTPAAYVDFTKVKSGMPICTSEASFSLPSEGAGSYLLCFPVLADRPHFFLRFRDLRPVKIGEIGNPRDIRPWVAKLQDPNATTRREAATALRDIGDPNALKPLMVALQDDYSGVRSLAAEALGEIGKKEAVEPLINLLQDEEQNVCANAAEALGKIGSPKAGEPLVKALKEVKAGYRRYIVDALATIRYTPAVGSLIDLLKNDPTEDNRRRAAFALGEIGDARAVEPLIAAVRTDRTNVRIGAARALGDLKDPRAIEALIEALIDDWGFEHVAAKALGKIGDPRAIEPLIAAITRKDKYSNLRSAAAEALDLIEPAWRNSPLAGKAASQCIAALKDKDPRIREAAAWELRHFEDPRSLEPLVAALKDENAEIRKATAYALGDLKSPKAASPLIAALKDADPSVRHAAATALGVMKAGQASEALEKLSEQDSDADVRKAAKVALENIRGSTAEN